MVVSYEIIDKQCAWQQERSLEGSDGPHCGWVQGVYIHVTSGTGGDTSGRVGKVTDMI